MLGTWVTLRAWLQLMLILASSYRKIYYFSQDINFCSFTKINFMSFEPLTNPTHKTKTLGSCKGKSTLLSSSWVVAFDRTRQKVNTHNLQIKVPQKNPCLYPVCPLYFAKRSDYSWKACFWLQHSYDKENLNKLQTSYPRTKESQFYIFFDHSANQWFIMFC